MSVLAPVPRSIQLLLVDDDEVDAELARRAFRKAGSTLPILRARNGIEALELLRGSAGAPSPLARPCVMLLDLRMPKLDGMEVLEALRSDPALEGVTVFVLSTSCSKHHKKKAYELGAVAYMVKTEDEDRLARMVRMIEEFCAVVELR